MDLKSPIFIIGAARSGTTLLAEILSLHPDVAYWIEPKYVWRYRDAGASSDVRSSETATQEVKRYITRRFQKFVSKSGKSRFLEKTPSNCFRIDFIREIFPSGKFIFLHRDGRDVAISAAKKWTSPPAKSAVLRRLRSFEIPLRDIPYYSMDFLRDVIARQFHAKGAYIWGPFFPGIREVRKTHDLIETCAIQWRECVRAMNRSRENLQPDSCIRISYEDLTDNPENSIKQIIEFCALRENELLISIAVKKIKAFQTSTWKDKLDQAQLQAIEGYISAELRELGYKLSSQQSELQSSIR